MHAVTSRKPLVNNYTIQISLLPLKITFLCLITIDLLRIIILKISIIFKRYCFTNIKFLQYFLDDENAILLTKEKWDRNRYQNSAGIDISLGVSTLNNP